MRLKKQQKETLTKKDKIYKIKPANIVNNYVDFQLCDDGEKSVFPAIKIKDVYENKTYYSAVIAISGVDIFHYNESDKEAAYRSFAAACSAMNLPHKYIFTDILPDFYRQKEYLKYKLTKATGFNSVMIGKRLTELEELEQYHHDRMSYMLIFSTEKSKLDDAVEMFIMDMKDTNLKVCDEDTILRLMRKMMSFETTKNVVDKGDINNYVYPEHINFESNCFNINGLNVSDVLDTATEFEKVQDLYNSIANGHEQVYSVTLRFIVTDKNKSELAKKIEKLRHSLEDEGLSSFVPINQMINEYFTLCLPSNKVKNPFPLYDTFSRQFPFYYYRNRNLSFENENKSIELLKRSYDEDKNMTSCYLLGKLLLERGDKTKAVEYIQIAADSGNKYAQFSYARLCNAVGNHDTAMKYAIESERNGNKEAEKITAVRKNFPAKMRVRLSDSLRYCSRHSQIISNRCAAAIKHLLDESDSHIKKLQSEFEYEMMRSQDRYVYYEREY